MTLYAISLLGCWLFFVTALNLRQKGFINALVTTQQQCVRAHLEAAGETQRKQFAKRLLTELETGRVPELGIVLCH
jgi:hypothetical protein